MTKQATQAHDKVQLAIFDFDGTCIDGNSPEILVWKLLADRMLSISNICHIISWAFRYKYHLPQNESKVRSRVFSAFNGKPVSEGDAYLRDFYDTCIKGLLRKEAVLQMEKLRERGAVVMVISASFEPIILYAQEDFPFTYQISTVMKKTPDGRYTNEVDGIPIEGTQKVVALCQFADKQFGIGNWEIAYCFADHYSDIDILSLAKCPVAVCPDATLRRHAKRFRWRIVDWKNQA